MAVTNYVMPRMAIFFVLCVIWMSINGRLYVEAQSSQWPSTTSAPEQAAETTPMIETRPVNLFIINEVTNEVANKSVTDSIKTMKAKNPDLIGNVITITMDGVDPKEDLQRVCDLWDTAIKEQPKEVPDLVLDTTRAGYAAEIVSAFTAAVGVPTLSAQFGQEGDIKNWRNLDADRYRYLVQVMPPTDLIPEAVRQLVHQMKISNAGVIFDESFNMDHKYKRLLLNVQARHILVPMKKSADEMRQLLNQLRELDIVNFFILGGENTLKSVLDVGLSLNFTGPQYGWYSLTEDDFEPRCNEKNVSLILFKPIMSSTQKHRLTELTKGTLLTKPLLTSAFYYDLARLGITAMSKSITKGNWPMNPIHISCESFNNENRPLRQFNYYKELVVTSAEAEFQPTFAGFDWRAKNGRNGAKFNMTAKMVKIVNGTTNSSEDLGIWSAGLDSYFQVKDVAVVKNHTASPSYRITTLIKAPFVMYDPKTKVWSGYCIELIKDIAAMLNFTYVLTEVADKKVGTIDRNGNWTGMIRELHKKRADIALGTVSIMAERETVVDFTVPYYDLVGISILMQKPKSETSLFKFLTVLEDDVWLCILGSYFFTSLLMWIFDRWSPYSHQNNLEKFKDDDEKREFSLRECLWFCMTSLTPQGGGEAPKNLSGRLVAATWWLFGFIIIASYTANLAAFLTVSRLETPVESLDDLSKQYKVQYAPIKYSEAYTYFQRMAAIEERFYDIWRDMSLNDSMTDKERAKIAVWDYPLSDKYAKMFHAMGEAKFPEDMEEAVQRVRRMNPKIKNEFALIGDATDIRYLEMTSCDLRMVGSEFSRKPYALAVQKGSPLKHALDIAILELMSKRKLEKLKTQWWDNNPKRVRCDKEEQQSDGISIANIGGVFIVIFAGIIVACCTLGAEYYWYRYRPKRKQESVRNASLKAEKQSASPIKFNIKPAKIAFEQNQVRSRF